MDASNLARVCALVGACVVATLSLAVPAASAAPHANPPTYHRVHFNLKADVYNPALPNTCTTEGFGYGSGGCNGKYDAPSAWDATEPFRGSRGRVNWVAKSDRVEIAFKTDDGKYITGWVPSRSSDRFAITDGNAWSHATNIETGNDAGAGPGDRGGPLRLTVEYVGFAYSAHYEMQAVGYVRYAEPEAPTIRCDPMAGTHVGEARQQPYSATCHVTGTPTPDVRVSSGSLPDGLEVGPIAANGDVKISGRVTQAGNKTFRLQATNSAGKAETDAQTITVARATTVPLIMITGTTTMPYGADLGVQAQLNGFDVGLASAVPSGSVTFYDGAITLGTAQIASSGFAQGLARLNLKLPIGSHDLRFTYAGDSAFTAAESATMPVTVVRASTKTTVSSSANPSRGGDEVRFSARVAPIAPGSGSPTGTVQFSFDGQPLGDPVPVVNGAATSPSVRPLTSRTYLVSATYSGDPNFEGSRDDLDGGQFVDRENTTTTVQTSDPRSYYGQAITFSATVKSATSGRTPTGTVRFYVDEHVVGSSVPVINGRATASPTTTLDVGRHQVDAIYTPDADFTDSRDNLGGLQIVSTTDTLTTVWSSSQTAKVGEPVTFTAVVSAANGGGTPVGSVVFVIDDRSPGTAVPLVNGRATLTTSSLRNGHHTVAAWYESSVRPGFVNSDGHLNGGQDIDG